MYYGINDYLDFVLLSQTDTLNYHIKASPFSSKGVMKFRYTAIQAEVNSIHSKFSTSFCLLFIKEISVCRYYYVVVFWLAGYNDFVPILCDKRFSTFKTKCSSAQFHCLSCDS